MDNQPNNININTNNKIASYHDKNIPNKNTTKALINKKIKVCLILSMILITTGLYLSYISNPKKIFKTAMNNLTTNLENIIITNDQTDIGENFTIKSTANFNIESSYINSLENKQSSTVSYKQLLRNINNSNTTLIYSQDTNNNKMLINLITNSNNEELINTKYLIENSTQYYYIKGLLDTYINNGSNNYFESIDDDNTTKQNIKYLYGFIINSLKENLNDDYFESKQEKITINNKMKNLTKVSIKLTNKKLTKIISNILNDLKNDPKANKILTSINKDFSKVKIKDSTIILGEKELLTLNIYTTNLLSNIKKYEFVYSNNDDEYKLTYEPQKISSTAYLIKNNKTLYKLTIKNTNNNYKIIITDSKDSSNVGQLTFDNTDKRSSIMFDFQDQKLKININYDKKLNDIKTNQSYNSVINLSIKITNNQVNIINSSVNITSKFTNQVEISEDISNSVLASSITETQKKLLSEKYSTIIPTTKTQQLLFSNKGE